MRLVISYVFYADVYFIQNMLLKITVLYLALLINKQSHRVHPIKIPIAAAMGTVMEILGLMYGGSFSFFVGMVYVMEMPLIFFFLLGKIGKIWIRVSVWAWLFVMFVNGVVEVLYIWGGQKGHLTGIVVVSCLAVFIGGKQFLEYQRQQKRIFSVELIHKDKIYRIQGLYDSGNQLKDPYSGKGIHIISLKLSQKMHITEDKQMLVPYRSLGNENALLAVYYLERIIIYGDKEKVEQWNVPIGVEEKGTILGAYDVLLNENVW